ncbi:hypothetical protein HDV64DRAFT_281362 [Trichoderma sp. TUCIM 5745]
MPESTESETLLAAEPSKPLGQNEEADETSYTTAVIVAGLLLGATLASMDVAYNTATYALIGSEFHNLENASWFILTHELIHSIAQLIASFIQRCRLSRANIILSMEAYPISMAAND